MTTLLQAILPLAALAFFLWMLATSRRDSGSELINPDDARQIGTLVGLTGGSIPDAATLRFALDRFQKQHGRRATTRDIGIVLGLINGMK
jgi:hypothetical protein